MMKMPSFLYCIAMKNLQNVWSYENHEEIFICNTYFHIIHDLQKDTHNARLLASR